MIELFYITNNALEAEIVDGLDIDWIFLDLEFIGKKERQIGRDTVLSNHSISDLRTIRNVVKNTKILVRSNPIGQWSDGEFELINERGSEIDAVMLPYFSTVHEVEEFLGLLDTSKVMPVLLVETLGAISNLDEILNLYPFNYVHIGLNDLHIERGTVSMFEPYIDGLLDKVTSTLYKNNQTFGIGGIGRMGSKLSPSPESVLNEHLRLNSAGVILSRSFKGVFQERKKDIFKQKLSKSVQDLRSYEKLARTFDTKRLMDSHKMMRLEIHEAVQNAKL